MGLQLLDVKKHHHHRTLSTGGVLIPSPTHSPNFFNQSLILSSDRSSPKASEENYSSPATAISANATTDQQLQQMANGITEKDLTGIDENGNGKESPHNKDSDLPESLEHNLPDSPFASPKAAGDYMSAFSNAAGEANKNGNATVHVRVCNLKRNPLQNALNCGDHGLFGHVMST